jgi:hypothetical protein
MSLYSLTKEKIADICDKIEQKRANIEAYESLTIENLWLADLDKFEEVYRKDLVARGFLPDANQQLMENFKEKNVV